MSKQTKGKKYVKVPKDLRIVVGWDADGKDITQPFDFYRHFLCRTVLSDKAFGTDYDALLTAMSIRGAFEGAKEDECVPLPLDHIEKLQAVVRKPSDGYQPIIMMQAGSYFDAILNTVDAPPALAEEAAAS